MSESPPKLSEGEVIDFKIISEEWNTFEVKDDKPVIIKGRLILSKVVRLPAYNPNGEPIYGTNTRNFFVSFAPKELKGPEALSEYSPEQKAASTKRELDFKTIEEHWNEYKFGDGTIHKVKLVVVGVQKTSLFTTDGDPLYNIQSQTVGRMIIPAGLHKKSSIGSQKKQNIS